MSSLDNVDEEHIGIIEICGLGGMALNATSLDPRIKATAAVTMYDMKKANGYFDEGNNEEVRYQKKKALNEQISNLL